MYKKIPFLILSLLLAGAVFAQEKRAITVEDLWAMGRVSDPQVSPDGRTIAYTVTYYDMEKNKGNSDVWFVPVKGGESRMLTNSPKGDSRPRWSPDGKTIAFSSSRGGSSQIWKIPSDGGEATQLTHFPTGAWGHIWSPDGKWIAFGSDVYPECEDVECIERVSEEMESGKVKAKVIDRLLFRHWNAWTDRTRSHVFLIPSEGGELLDVTKGDFDTPPISLGSSHDYVFSPDSKEICFVRNTDELVAASTNNDLFIVSVPDGEPKGITDSKANDIAPLYSPDGKYIAYLAMARPGFEADKLVLTLYDRKTGKTTALTGGFDRSVSDFVWSPKSRSLYFRAGDEGYISIYSVDLRGKVKQLTSKLTTGNLRITPNGKTLVFTVQKMSLPGELFTVGTNGRNLKQVTFTNKDLLAELEMNDPEEFTFEGNDGWQVHGFLLKPPFFDPSKKYPLIYLVHGGPQGAWEDEFHYRWNAQMFAAPGYVTAMVNFTGSTGYGQEFTDRITQHWGDRPFEDLVKGLDYLVNTYDFIDQERIGSAGASYGGFMMNWFAGHIDSFTVPIKVLVNHDGVFDQRSMYGSTEELWFPEWELGGTPWTNPELYEKWNPSSFAANFKTPMLVIHSENDFRVPVTQGFQVFTTLQRLGVPSRLLYFPDEDHFVRKPQNARLWWNTVYDWFEQYLK